MNIGRKMTTPESLSAPDQVLAMTEVSTQILTCNEIQPATARGTLFVSTCFLLHIYLKREFNYSGVLGYYPLHHPVWQSPSKATRYAHSQKDSLEHPWLQANQPGQPGYLQ